MKILILFISLPLMAAQIQTDTYQIEKVKKLNVENDSGKIFVKPTSSNEVIIKAEKVKFGSHCVYKHELNGNTLDIEVEKRGLSFKDCLVNIEVQAPKNVAQKLETGSGNITVEGTSGEIDFMSGSGDVEIKVDEGSMKGSVGSGDIEVETSNVSDHFDMKTGSGDIKLQAKVKKVQARTGSGSIELKGLIDEADLKTGSGSLTVYFDEKSKKGNLKMKTGSGDGNVYLPTDAIANTNLSSGSGKLRSEIPTTLDAGRQPFQISMKTGSGDLNLFRLK